MAKHTIANIEKATGLNKNFIRKCVKSMGDILKPERGAKNSLLFESNAFIIFQRIGEKKKDGLALPEIEESLRAESGDIQTGDQTGETEKTQGSNRSVKTGQTYSNRGSNSDQTDDVILQLKAELIEKDRVILETENVVLERDRIILDKDKEIFKLQTQLQLTAPKDPEEDTEPEENQKAKIGEKKRSLDWIGITLWILAVIIGFFVWWVVSGYKILPLNF